MKRFFYFTAIVGFLAFMISCTSEQNNSADDAQAQTNNTENVANEAQANNANTQVAENKPAATQSQVNKPKPESAPAVSSGEIEVGNEIGNDLGDFESYDPDSVIRKMSDSRGKLTLMVLWNSLCGHCVIENEKYKAAWEQYHDKKFVNGDGFEVYSIALDKVRTTWIEMLEEKKYPWAYNVYVLDSWKDPEIRFFGIKNLPGTFLLDEDGIVLAKKFTGDELSGLLEGYLKK